MKEILFEFLIALVYWWFVAFWAILLAWYVGIVWSALLFALGIFPYYELMTWVFWGER